MKICILTPRFPFPENGGDVLRINNIARYLKSQGHKLLLVSFKEQDIDTKEAELLYDKIFTIKRSKADSIIYSALFMLRGYPIQCGYYHSKTFEREFKKIIEREQPDRFIAHLLRMVPYLERNGLNSKSTVEMTDALSKTYSLSANAKGGLLKRMIYRIERKLIFHYEQYVIRKFPKVVLVSQADINSLTTTANATSITSLSLHTNGVECLDKPATQYNPDKICFIGNMRTLQNQDAVIHFINDIFPIILTQKPNAIFYIVGAEPPVSIINLAKKHNNIIVTGFVDDLVSAVSDSCMAVAPVQVAAGIQNKVLVAMGIGIPVVMTPLIAQAINELCDGKNCLISDDNHAFAEKCVSLMNDAKLRVGISLQGYNTVKSHYSWNEKLNGY